MGLWYWNRVVTVERAAELLADKRIAVLTGAGISTDSGIPDYRGKGAPARKPVTYQTFVTDAAARRRVWAGSHAGWEFFRDVAPNEGHYALAAMDRAGLVEGVLTQNVDALHERAGSRNVTHMHGRIDRVRCVDCGVIFPRDRVALLLRDLNPDFFFAQAVRRPDGDADVDPGDEFVVPDCPTCHGMLKPDVVFYGELMRPEVIEACEQTLARSNALIVAGSSLVVNSGMRMLRFAKRRGMPSVIINRGETKGDGMATLRLEGGASELLGELAEQLAGSSL